MVEPASSVPYWISDWRVRSSADEIGTCIRSIVRKAAKLAVYVDTMMSVKNHQALPTIRPDADLPVTLLRKVTTEIRNYTVFRKKKHPLLFSCITLRKRTNLNENLGQHS